MSRYDGGRLIFIATVNDGFRGSLMRWNCSCIQARVNWKRSVRAGSTNGAR